MTYSANLVEDSCQEVEVTFLVLVLGGLDRDSLER